ncbi:MAG: hypothetical protein M3Y59_09610 [Myxococcota bacterium]|nr:hypothetical protein [Myxococcota bacterium]
MTELVTDLLPWLAAFYLLDAVVQLRRGQVLFDRDWGGGFGLRRFGLHASALSPLGVSVLAHDLPYLPTPLGVWLFDPQVRRSPPVIRPEALRFLAWAELAPVRAERSAVKSGDQLLFRARSPRGAQTVASGLESLRRLAEGEREAAISVSLARALDLTAAQNRWRRVRLPLALTTAFCTAGFLLLFAGLPYAAYLSTAELRWERTLGALLLAHLGTLLSAGWTLSRAGAGAGGVAAAVFTLGIFPAFAARAGTQILREAFVEWDPLAISGALLTPQAFLQVARYEAVRGELSRHATAGLGLAPFWSARMAAQEKLFREAGTTTSEAVAPPRLSGDARGWCPLCLGEYRDGFAQCSDCEVPLQPAVARAESGLERPPGATPRCGT